MGTNALGSDDVSPRTITLDVPEMDCPSCAEKIVNSVLKLDGVVTVKPQVITGTVRIKYLHEAIGGGRPR